jgi:hypothetical protein
MSPSRFTLTPAERTAIETICEELPGILATFSRWIASLLDDLGRTSQGRVVTQADADELLLRLRDEAVASMLAHMEPWGDDEGLREPVVDLLVRYLLAESRAGFVSQVVGATRN